MKTLQERLQNKRIDKKAPLLIDDCLEEAKSFLEDYREKVQQEDGTPDVKVWFYQAVDELEALLCVDSTTKGENKDGC